MNFHTGSADLDLVTVGELSLGDQGSVDSRPVHRSQIANLDKCVGKDLNYRVFLRNTRVIDHEIRVAPADDQPAGR